MNSRLSALPTVGMSHWEVRTPPTVGKTFPEPSWLVVLREGLPGLPFHSLSRRAAQLFLRVGNPSMVKPRLGLSIRGKLQALFFRVSILTRKRPTRKKLYDRLKIYRVTKAAKAAAGLEGEKVWWCEYHYESPQPYEGTGDPVRCYQGVWMGTGDDECSMVERLLIPIPDTENP